MAFADSEGTRLYYDDRGVGEPVFVCLPGWCVHSRHKKHSLETIPGSPFGGWKR